MPATQISIAEAETAAKTLKTILISDNNPEAIVLFSDNTFCCLFAHNLNEERGLQIAEDVGDFSPIDFGSRALVNAGMWSEEEIAVVVAATATQRKAEIELQERRVLAALLKKYPPPAPLSPPTEGETRSNLRGTL